MANGTFDLHDPFQGRLFVVFINMSHSDTQ